MTIAVSEKGEKMTRDEALEILKAIYFIDEKKQKALNMAIETLERKHGKWIDQVVEDELLAQKCSVCGYLEYVYGRPNYCPNCGADMRGEEDEIQGKK